MPSNYIKFRDTHYFSSLLCDYLDENEHLKPFYHRFPKLENFKFQIEEKKASFLHAHREVLYNAILHQYTTCDVSAKTLQHIEELKHDNTFTVTTGHQLNLFTGPLYFFYKIMSTINLCEQLKQAYPENNFVPVYWMATEDHDFDEINFFNFKGKKVQWNANASGAVGELHLQELQNVYEVFEKQLDNSINSTLLKESFKNAYLNHNTLTEATRYLVNHYFKAYGLVIVDGNDTVLKRLFIPYLEDEILHKSSFKNVSNTNNALNELPENYKIQVNPREINLFYLDNNLRERIVFEDDTYKVVNTKLQWTKNDFIEHLKDHPEKFSPNVLIRPMYQEVILPNLCYIGGGGEMAYWFQLKSNFDAQKVTFPIVLLRNSVLIITEKQIEKLNKLNVSVHDLFLSQEALRTKVTKAVSEVTIDFSTQKEHLKKQFVDLYALAQQTDKSFIGAVKAQEVKQIKGLDHLEKRLLKAQKRKLKDHLNRVIALQNELFPNQSLQERQLNFSEFYLEYGQEFIQQLKENLHPLKDEFLILEF